MSVSATITSSKPISIDLEKILDVKYYYGVRDNYDIVVRGELSNYMVFFDCLSFGRGVDVAFTSDKSLNINLPVPASTSDLDLFIYLIKKIAKTPKTTEIIFEGEVFSISKLNEIKKIAKTNMESALDFISRKSKEEIEIIGVQGPIAIDDIERKEFANDQRKFDHYLDKKQMMPGTHEIIAPLIADTDRGSIWIVSLKAGRYIILPKYARPRNRKMKVDKYCIISSANQKVIDYHNFLKEVDTSRRYDAERFIIKLSKAEINRIFEKYPDARDELIANT